MAIRDCKVIAIEGAHGTGKSTLVYALMSYYKSRHIHAVSLSETARRSPFVEEIVIHHTGEFDISAELHLFGAQIAEEQVLARYHQLLVCDRTIANILGYSRLLLESKADKFGHDILKALQGFCRSYVQQYDAVFYASDFYDLSVTRDPFRPGQREFQVAADSAIRDVCSSIGLKVNELPKGLSSDEKVAWVSERVSI